MLYLETYLFTLILLSVITGPSCLTAPPESNSALSHRTFPPDHVLYNSMSLHYHTFNMLCLSNLLHSPFTTLAFHPFLTEIDDYRQVRETADEITRNKDK